MILYYSNYCCYIFRSSHLLQFFQIFLDSGLCPKIWWQSKSRQLLIPNLYTLLTYGFSSQKLVSLLIESLAIVVLIIAVASIVVEFSSEVKLSTRCRLEVSIVLLEFRECVDSVALLVSSHPREESMAALLAYFSHSNPK